MSAVTVWLPKQYGAWAMLLAPSVAGGLMAGFKWPNWLLLAAWVVAYLSFTATRGALGRRQRRFHAVAAVTYGVFAVAAIAVLLVWRLALVWWAIPLGVLLGGSLALITAGRERSAVNDACLIGASCLVTAVSGTCLHLSQSLGWAAFTDAIKQPPVWLATAVMAAYFLGTIPYIKSMIRERGNPAWYAGSVAYHWVVVLLSVLTMHAWLIVFAVLIALRATLVPRLWPRAKPKYLGIGEMTGTVIILLIIGLTLAG